MEYKLLFGSSSDELSNQVNKYLNEGWILYGYPIVYSGGRFQAVIKPDTPVFKFGY